MTLLFRLWQAVRKAPLWPALILVTLLLILVVTLSGRYFSCLVRVKYDPDQLNTPMDEIQLGCWALLDPFLLFQ